MGTVKDADSNRHGVADPNVSYCKSNGIRPSQPMIDNIQASRRAVSDRERWQR